MLDGKTKGEEPKPFKDIGELTDFLKQNPNKPIAFRTSDTDWSYAVFNGKGTDFNGGMSITLMTKFKEETEIKSYIPFGHGYEIRPATAEELNDYNLPQN